MIGKPFPRPDSRVRWTGSQAPDPRLHRAHSSAVWILVFCTMACVSGSGTARHPHRQLPEQWIEAVDVQCANIDPPRKIRHVDPEYPEDVRGAKIEGTVEVRAIVGWRGEVTDLRVYSSPSDALSRLALEAVKQWRYNPALCNGQPIRVYLKAVLRFRL